MSLQFIYGKSGRGKSEYILEDVKNNISLDKKIYIITPEQFSYSAEKNLLQKLRHTIQHKRRSSEF